MAFFKFRLPGQGAADAQGNFSNSPTESVEVMRRRARHRLIGASVLVLVGVIGFPMVFDTQPRPVASDITIDIPERAQPVAKSAAKPAAPLQASAGLDAKEELVGKGEPPAADKSAESKVADVKPADTKPADAKATETKAPEAKANDEPKADAPRFVVQVGAYGDEAKVRDVRHKLEKAGFKTYTQVADTKEGKRTRVRVGPFGSRDDADKAVAKLKQLNFQAQVLSL